MSSFAKRGNSMTLTKVMAYAAGQDAGNASMRKAGRIEWNEDDFNAAAAEFARLVEFLK